MPSTSELRKKIKGVVSTRQITNAMQMVASARFARVLRAMTNSTVFPGDMERIAKAFIPAADIQKIDSIFMAKPGDEELNAETKIGLVVIGGDKGLCGDFNGSVIRAAKNYIRNNTASITRLFTIGNKINHLLRRERLPVITPYAAVFFNYGFHQADRIGQDVLDAFVKREVTRVRVLYNTFHSSTKYVLTNTELLPLTIEAEDIASDNAIHEFEPSPGLALFETIAHYYVKGTLNRMIRQSFAAELSARMLAMGNATRNADELIDTLTLEMNKTRQAGITREIAEITATGEIMKE